LNRYSRTMALMFGVLLVATTLAVTLLAVMDSEYGILPLFVPAALGFIGLVVFKWIPRLHARSGEPYDLPPEVDAMPQPDGLPSDPTQLASGPDAQLPLMFRVAYALSVGSIYVCQAAAVLTALTTLGGIIVLMFAG